MDLTVGQAFTVTKAFMSPPGVPKSKYIEGGTYRVTDQNKAFVADHITAGDAYLGEPARKAGERLNAPKAILSGTAIVK